MCYQDKTIPRCLVDILKMSYRDKTIPRQSYDILKMSCAGCVKKLDATAMLEKKSLERNRRIQRIVSNDKERWKRCFAFQ